MLGVTDFSVEKEVPFIEFGHGSVVLGAISNYGVVNMIGFYPAEQAGAVGEQHPDFAKGQPADCRRPALVFSFANTKGVDVLLRDLNTIRESLHRQEVKGLDELGTAEILNT